jgi:rubrerythrin
MAKVKVLRCRICGDPYIGTEPPTRCPFCGAKAGYFVQADQWNPDEFNVELSDQTRQDLGEALKLELSNTSFYTCAENVAKNSGDEYGFAKFKSLRKVESEHASAISKFLKISKPPIEAGTCSQDFGENTQEGFDRESRAIKAYTTFRDRATEPRLQEFFGALVEIETDHLDLHAENLGK